MERDRGPGRDARGHDRGRDLLDRVRADGHRPRRHPAAVDGGLRLRARRTSTRRTSATSTTSSTTTGRRASPSTTRSSASTRASPGSTRSRPTARATPTTRCRARSRTSPTSSRPTATSLAARLRDARPAGARRLALRVRLGARATSAVAPGTFPPDEVPTLIRPRLRPQRQRQPLADQPRGAADRLRPDHRDRGRRADHCGRGSGLIQVEDRLAGTDGLPGNRFNRKLLAAGRARQPPVRWASSGATRVRQLCESAPGGDAARLERARWTWAAPAEPLAELEPPRRPRLERGDPLPPLRVADLLDNFTAIPTGPAGRDAARARRSIFTTPYSNADPSTRRAASTSATRSSARRWPTPSPTSRAPASRSTRRCAASSTSSAAASTIPIHGGPGGLGVFNAINVPWDPALTATATSSTARASSWPPQFVDREVPGRRGHVRHLQRRARTTSSKHAADYTRAFSQKRWNDAPFCNAEVRKATRSTQRISIRAGKRR